MLWNEIPYDEFAGYERNEPFFEGEFLAIITAVNLDTSLITASFTGNVTAGSATITNISIATGLSLGQIVAGTGIPAGAYIIAVNSDNSTITLSANAAASGVGVSLTGAMYLYTWAEQGFDETTGQPYTLDGGRSGDNTSDPAVEINNQLVTVPQYVLMKHRTQAQAQAVYEFSAPEEALGTVTLTFVTNVCPIF